MKKIRGSETFKNIQIMALVTCLLSLVLFFIIKKEGLHTKSQKICPKCHAKI
jgi:hypothetical protein